MNHAIRIAVLLILSLAVHAAVDARADSGDNPGLGTTLELYSLTTDVSFQFSSNPPQAGDRAIFGRDLYLLGGTIDAPAPVGDPIGRNTVVCTLVTTTEASCEGRWLLNGLGLITGAAYLELAQGTTGGPGAALTGGSGVFEGAEGVIGNVPVPGTEDQVWIIELTGFSEP